MKRGTPRHPKMLRLLQALGLHPKHKAEVVGYLELLWHFTAEYAPRGDIGRYADDQIEGACEWYGKCGRLVEAFTTSGWVDMDREHRLIVHDWSDHADGTVKKKLERAGQSFLVVTDKLAGQNLPKVPIEANNGGLARGLARLGKEVLSLPVKQEFSTRASDLNGQTSQRFDEFWSKYPRTVGKDSACRDRLSVALVVDEPAIFACLENYLASGDVARGAVMNAGSTPRGVGWIMMCAKERWACRWPTVHIVKKESKSAGVDRAIREVFGDADETCC